jgi:prefoldin subunit 5
MAISINGTPANMKEFSKKLDEVNKGNKIIEEHMESLAKIVDQLEKAQFECPGGKIEMNVAFIALKKLAELQERGELIQWFEKHTK